MIPYQDEIRDLTLKIKHQNKQRIIQGKCEINTKSATPSSEKYFLRYSH